MEHKYIESENGIVHYWIHRHKNVDTNYIVFTHGLTANHSMFDKQVKYFTSNYSVITWDIPLHGLSRPYVEFTYKETAIELKNILEQEKIQKIILVGMSMGGYTSQMFANIYPDMVQGFVGLDTTPFGLRYYTKSDLWWLKKIKPIAKLFTDGILRKSMASSVSKTKYSYNKMLKMLEPLTKEQIIEQMDIAYGVFATENTNIKLSCPVLLLLGDSDITGKVKKYNIEWKRFTGYPLHIISNAAHFSNGDNPKQVNKEIENFIKKLNQ